MYIRVVLPIIAAILLLEVPAVAQEVSGEDGTAPSTIVKFGDLNLSSPEGGGALLVRIRQAARRVCGPEPYGLTARRTEYRPCVKRAVDEAVARVGDPMLTALNGGKASNVGIAIASR